MEAFYSFINLILHLDQHLLNLISLYGTWTYAILFVIIFCETGLVITPILPGDSLLFAAGSLAAHTAATLNIHFLFILLLAASILGNGVNYSIGRFIGQRVFHFQRSRFFNPQHLEKAHRFYEKHGGKALVLARFIPIIRSFAPFVAGAGYMHFPRFIFYNVTGALLWVGSLLYLSYWFGNLPFIKEHFSTVILALIVLSLLPPLLAYLRFKPQTS
ncbi:MAG TPA: DedA family protein [Gammaproteobacteria bacterium]|nr:DedA family protein [Gammaproteobacteria bacterium]